MNILVLGSNGMAGSMIARHLLNEHNVTTMGRKNFDVLKDELPNLDSYDYVINCIGLIKQRVVIDDNLFFIINSDFPQKLSLLCKKLIHISSDCVFSGLISEGEAYYTDDITDALDSYGKSKAKGEVIKNNAMVLRTSIIGPAKDNNGLFEWFRKSQDPKGFYNHLWSGITTLELAKIINNIILTNSYKTGLYQIASEKITKYNLLCLINTMFNLNKKITYEKAPSTINRVLVPDIKAQNISHQLFELKNSMNNSIL
jgi:dTDP-4-dehydrorhamnose reductase